ncbi:DUF2946 family protein [Bradyrhizobium sp. dw_78]|uniref:DUF2946 family protein n=1 Tax=Bradyrhizobium sp. dw_78 TaxID=2719793 RepID=UPI001BD2B397|nr:DUF2946 family protein [Bradyrhizobium sp. dw_78]
MAQANGTLLRTFVQRCGVYLALAALMLQFALSFGHIHAQDFHAGIAYPEVADVKADAVGGWHGPAKLEISAPLPSKLADDDDHCPICLSTFLLSTSFIPDALRPPPSSEFNHIDRLLALAFDIAVEAHRAPFQSRAPPLG